MGLIPIELLRAADEWEAEAENQRRMSKLSPIADTLAYCAADLRERARQAEAARRNLSTAQYARIANVAPGTVRKWCARGWLDATRAADGDWIIPANARVRRVA